MKKQIVSIFAVAGLSVASLAGAADINIFGASAQFDFVNANAVNFVHQYCTTTVPAWVSGTVTNGRVLQYKTTNGNTVKNGIVSGSNCTGIPGSTDTTLNFFYSGIASGEGVKAMNGTGPLDSDLNSGCTVTGERRVAKVGTAATATLTDADLPNYVTNTVCNKVTIGTSDTAFNQFNQKYSNEWDTADGSNTLAQLETFAAPSGKDDQTVAVPFAFYVNPNVKAKHCVAATPVAPKVGGVLSVGSRTGGYCTVAADCVAPGTPLTDSVTCEGTATTIDNLSRLQANILFSGQITNWNQLGSYFTSNPVKLCIRKPGSGTLVAFDKTVMTAGGQNGWGSSYATIMNSDLTNAAPYTVFNGSSTDEKNCIAGLDTFAAADGSTALAAANGAVGFMDADTTSVANQFSRVSYNGVPPTRNNVRNGAYEFYTIGHMYNDNSALSQAVVNWVLNPANVPSGKAAYWASKNELKFMRGTDIGYPAKGTPSATVTP